MLLEVLFRLELVLEHALEIPHLITRGRRRAVFLGKSSFLLELKWNPDIEEIYTG